MKNIFDIDHHSASTINSFIEYRTKWYLNKIRGIKMPFSHAAARGTACEHGMNHYLTVSKNIDECVSEALKKYTESSLGLADNFDIRQSIGRCVSAGIESFKKRGYDDGNTTLQNSISVFLDGCSLPTTGYLDYLRPDRVIDNKCVAKTPTMTKDKKHYQHKQAYIIQGAIYWKATGLKPYFHYVIPLKDEVKVVEEVVSNDDLEWGLKYATKAAQTLEKIYENPISGDLMEAFFFPNADALFGDEIGKILSEFGL